MGRHLDFMSNEHMEAWAYIVQCDPNLVLRPTTSMIDDCDVLSDVVWFDPFEIRVNKVKKVNNWAVLKQKIRGK